MKLAACLLVGCFGWFGCRSDPPVATPYTHDIEKLCNVSTLSKADPGDPAGRTLMIANWLAANLETPESHDFLIKIQPLDGADKADALDAEAKRVGLASCPLSTEWRH